MAKIQLNQQTSPVHANNGNHDEAEFGDYDLLGSENKRQDAHTLVMTTSTTCSTNVKLENSKYNASSREWAVSGWENSVVYKLMLSLTMAGNMQMCNSAKGVRQ